MKTALLSLLLILGLSSSSFAKEYNPRCDFEDEEVSATTKLVKFPQYGIQMEIPDNLRAMLRNDGVVQILNNSTYRILQCPLKDRIGRGYSSYHIYKAKGQYMRTIPLAKKGMYFVIRGVKVDDTVYFEMAIRMQTSVGLVDISIMEDGSIIESDLKVKEEEYNELAKMISLLE